MEEKVRRGEGRDEGKGMEGRKERVRDGDGE